MNYRSSRSGDLRRADGTALAGPLPRDLQTSPVAPFAAVGSTRGGAPRLDNIDMLRGLVIVLMVLDHVRDYFHVDAWAFSPTDPLQTTPLLFATRWITHLCAPTFVFLAGVSIFLQRANGKQSAALTRFLLTRGLWLMLLEVTLVAFGFDFSWPFVFLQVIWVIGVSMVLMAAVVRFPPRAVLALGTLIVCGHGMLSGVEASELGAWALAWRLAFEPGPAWSGLLVYPAIPWFGVMCLGYGLGCIFLAPAGSRRRSLMVLGASALVAFFVLRAINGFGDPAPWTVHDSAAATILSFFNVTKYPPSLHYVLVTCGLALLLCLALERLKGWPARVLLAFGRTPLLTYVLHIYVAHASALAIGIAMGVPASYFVEFVGGNFQASAPSAESVGWGFNLPMVYVVWIAVLATLYPISAWFAEIKRRRRDWWLSYL